MKIARVVKSGKETFGLVKNGKIATKDDITHSTGIPIPLNVKDFLFDGWRYLDEGRLDMSADDRSKNTDFILNQQPYDSSQILLTRDNFGCGSSREHAPWSLLDFGFKCIIAPSFADIFYNNCFKNGILPIILGEEKIKELSEYSKRQEEIEIDLKEEKIVFGNHEVKFEIDAFKKKCLLEGLDDIALSLEKSEKISSFETELKNKKPWIFSD